MRRIPVPKARPKKEMNSNDEFEKSIEKRQNWRKVDQQIPGWSILGSWMIFACRRARKEENENWVNQQRNQDSEMMQQGTSDNGGASQIDSLESWPQYHRIRRVTWGRSNSCRITRGRRSKWPWDRNARQSQKARSLAVNIGRCYSRHKDMMDYMFERKERNPPPKKKKK